MNDKKMAFLNLVLFAILIAVLASIIKPSQVVMKDKVEIRKISSPILSRIEIKEAQIYDINKIKERKESGPVKEKNTQDMTEVWSKANPQDKANLANGLEKKIKESREALELKPDDKKAKALLVISEALKDLIVNKLKYKVGVDDARQQE